MARSPVSHGRIAYIAEGVKNICASLISVPLGQRTNEIKLSFFILASLEAAREAFPLVAPYCGIPRDYLSDTPAIVLRAMGFWCLNMANWARCPRPLFPWRACEVEVQYPPQNGYLSDTCAIPYENKAKRVRYPPLRYYLERVLGDMGGCLALGR